MFNISPKIIDTLQELYDDPVGDYHEISSACLIGLQQNIADLNTFLLATTGKKITDKRRGISTQFLSNIIFYVAILLHLNDIPPDMFDMSNDADNGIIHVTENFNEAFRHSPLLLGTFLMGTAVEISQLMWEEDFIEDGGSLEHALIERATVAATPSTALEIPDEAEFKEFMAMLTPPAPSGDTWEELEDTDFEVDTERQEELFSVFESLLGGVMIMADLCDIDLGVCMYNASQQTEL